MINKNLTFLKLGGSLITDKTTPLTARLDVIGRIANEIALAKQQNPSLQLVIGHGSGSFGHAAASLHQTQSGGKGKAYWQGFAEVWAAARTLNQIVVESLIRSGLPVIAFPPSAGVVAEENALRHWNLRPIKAALSHNLIPVVQGDDIFDMQQGGTIFSTEVIFQYLAKDLLPRNLLLAGSDEGVYTDSQQPENVIARITPSNVHEVLPVLSGAEAVDVTGGMLAKVMLMVSLVEENPQIEVQIFSGLTPGNIQEALMGEKLGTAIHSATEFD